jgi:hypothetical protein
MLFWSGHFYLWILISERRRHTAKFNNPWSWEAQLSSPRINLSRFTPGKICGLELRTKCERVIYVTRVISFCFLFSWNTGGNVTLCTGADPSVTLYQPLCVFINSYFARSDFACSFYHAYFFPRPFPFIILNRYFILRPTTTEADKEKGRQAEKLVTSWSKPHSCDYVVIPEVNSVMLLRFADVHKNKIKADMTWNLIKWACNGDKSHQRCFDLGTRMLTVSLPPCT